MNEVSSYMSELDPDLNFLYENFNELFHSESSYIDFSSFNDTCVRNPNYFTFFSYNIRSYRANSDSLFCSLHGNYPEFCIFSETWFSLNYFENILDYSSHHTFREEDRRSGGVSVYIKNYLPSHKLSELSYANINIEVCTVECTFNHTDSVIIAIYRPHSGTILDFQHNLEEILNNRAVRGKNILIFGDFNVNLLDDSSTVQEFIHCLQSLGFIPIITKPTRFNNSSNSSSLLDQIWINKPSSYDSGIISSDITDHLPTYLRIPKVQNLENNPNPIRFDFRPVTLEGKLKFEDELSTFAWDQIHNADPNVFMENYIKKLNEIYIKCFPKKTKIVSSKNLLNPWITTKLRKLLDLKSDYFQLYKMNLVTKRENNALKNRVKSIVSKSKTIYYRNLFKKNRSKIRETWKLIQKLTSCKINLKKSFSKIVHDNITYHEDSKIADLFSEHFSSISQNLAENIPQTNVDPISYINFNNPSSLCFFNPVSIDECIRLILDLNNTKQNLNSIPVSLLKEYSCYIAPILTNIINSCLSSGTFPNVLKIATVTPIPKQGSPFEIKNYRPISVLPIFSKILEKCVLNRIVKYFSDHSIISPNQFGFLRGVSTENAVCSLMDILYDVIDRREFAICVFVDFAKAFDCVPHDILLRKAEAYGVRGVPLLFIKDFLSNRSQKVKINNSFSSSKPITTGVPQGSILGPLCFLIYVNDLPNFSTNCQSILYADDTTLCFRGNTLSDLIVLCNRELENFCAWANANKININFDKTLATVVTNNRIDSNLLQLSVNNLDIKFETSCKFLGLYFDSDLKFRSHISYISGKLSKSIGILFRIKDYLPTEGLISIYYSIIYPYLIYCNLVWGNTYETILNHIFILQKRALRLINKVEFRAHTNDLFYENEILKLKDINVYRQAIHMFNSDFQDFNRNHSHFTRNRNSLLPHFSRTTLTQQSLLHSAPLIWNSLPERIKNIERIGSFKINMKRNLIDNYGTGS